MRALGVLLVAAVLLAACGSDSNDNTAKSAASGGGATQTTGGVRPIDGDIGFAPDVRRRGSDGAGITSGGQSRRAAADRWQRAGRPAARRARSRRPRQGLRYIDEKVGRRSVA